MRLRYNYRLYPTTGQRQALAGAFGCARVVFNDGCPPGRRRMRPDFPMSPTPSCRRG
ncbi:MAG TPA: helix-turn-helix domain-containing protein [Trebonia sp.]|nr:helix-turn-helix domain-containing protein [Trebonia sp.]